MTKTTKADRARIRAARLMNEARNCVAIATAARDSQFSADLIDEAVRLSRRAQELAL